MRIFTFAAVALSSTLGLQAASSQVPVSNRAPLQQNAYDPLPLGAVKPRGWLLQQERIQAQGLTGHLDEFWNDVGPNSGWLGGSGESWERGPYYLDGLLPLAYQLQDTALIEKSRKWVEWTLQSQQPDGQFGPKSNDDWWPRMVMLKVLTQYAEATGDQRVVPFLSHYFEYEAAHLPERPLRDWGKYRWQDNAYTVLWLYNRTGDSKLLELAKLLHSQGYDWEAQFDRFRYTHKETVQDLGLGKGSIPERAMQTHGVNNAMALKAAPVWWLVSGDTADQTALYRQLAMLDEYHGLPNGMYSADEHLAGPDPSQGTELCAVVETMFSYEAAFAVLGDSHLGDRLERITYNALPATLSDDMWSHQYDQQPNQIACTRAHRQWSTNGPDSNMFGLEPNFGCCTANLHQGWPKFVSALWMASPDGGLVTAAYGPSEVHATLNGVSVGILEDTLYPFRGDIELHVDPDHSTKFSLRLRVPAWSNGIAVKVNGQAVDASADANGFFDVRREWKRGDSVHIAFAMEPRVSHWYHGAVVFERGPLVFALPLDGEWKEVKQYAQRSADWEITPRREWNYAVAVGDCVASVRESKPDALLPFSSNNPAVALFVSAKKAPEWKEEEHSAGSVPSSPVTLQGPEQTLKLVPYGAAKLRITEFPYLSGQTQCVAKGKGLQAGTE